MTKLHEDPEAERDRGLAAANSEEYAVPLDIELEWDAGAPLPYLLQNDSKAFMTFYAREPDPNWDDTYVTIRDPASQAAQSLVLVEFIGCISAKLGSPNDELFDGHPLYGKGMSIYSAQQVINSRWLAEFEQVNKVHSQYSQDFWRQKRHYVFWFHDSTVECIAESLTVERFGTSLRQLLDVVCDRLTRT